MSDNSTNPFIDFAKTQETIGLAEGKAQGALLVERVRSGELDAHALAQELRNAALNAFDPYSLLGLAAAIVEALAPPQP